MLEAHIETPLRTYLNRAGIRLEDAAAETQIHFTTLSRIQNWRQLPNEEQFGVLMGFMGVAQRKRGAMHREWTAEFDRRHKALQDGKR